MNKKTIISLLMVLVLILSMSPASSVSARVNSGSFSFPAFPNRPKTSFSVTCSAWLNGRKMTGSFSYSTPSAPHLFDFVQQMRFDAYNLANDRFRYEIFSRMDYATMDLDFNPDTTKYEYFFNGQSKGALHL